MESNLGVRRVQSLFLQKNISKEILITILRVKEKCLEERIARYRILKLKYGVINIYQEKGVDLDNHNS